MLFGVFRGHSVRKIQRKDRNIDRIDRAATAVHNALNRATYWTIEKLDTRHQARVAEAMSHRYAAIKTMHDEILALESMR